MPDDTFTKTYLARLGRVMDALDAQSITNGVAIVREAWESGRQIIAAGNGGSALTALHYINDWSKSITHATGRPFKGRSLVDNIGLVMSYANDVSYEEIFVEQLKAVLTPGDLFIGISGSGNSENVLRAVQYANDNGAVSLGISGYPGCKLLSVAQHNFNASISDMQLAEDIHMMFGHIVMRTLCGATKLPI